MQLENQGNRSRSWVNIRRITQTWRWEGSDTKKLIGWNWKIREYIIVVNSEKIPLGKFIAFEVFHHPYLDTTLALLRKSIPCEYPKTKNPQSRYMPVGNRLLAQVKLKNLCESTVSESQNCENTNQQRKAHKLRTNSQRLIHQWSAVVRLVY